MIVSHVRQEIHMKDLIAVYTADKIACSIDLTFSEFFPLETRLCELSRKFSLCKYYFGHQRQDKFGAVSDPSLRPDQCHSGRILRHHLGYSELPPDRLLPRIYRNLNCKCVSANDSQKNHRRDHRLAPYRRQYKCYLCVH